jgi:hypothetical protein
MRGEPHIGEHAQSAGIEKPETAHDGFACFGFNARRAPRANYDCEEITLPPGRQALLSWFCLPSWL